MITCEVKCKVFLVHALAGVVSFTPHPLYLCRMGPWCPWSRRLGGLQSWLEHSGKEKISCLYQDFNHDFALVQFVVQSLYLLDSPGDLLSRMFRSSPKALMLFMSCDIGRKNSHFLAHSERKVTKRSLLFPPCLFSCLYVVAWKLLNIFFWNLVLGGFHEYYLSSFCYSETLRHT